MINIKEKAYTINYKGKEIICLDITGFTPKDIVEYRKTIEEAKKLIASKPEHSALVITNVTGVNFDKAMSDEMKEYTKHNTPYVKASAIVGLSGMQKVVLSAIKALTKREYTLFNTIEEAKEWLATQ